MTPPRRLTIVVPVKDEEDAVPAFLDAIRPVLEKLRQTSGIECDLLFVDDGSRDATVERILGGASGIALRIVRLSRSFGKEAALTAGLAHASSEAAITIDIDLQDPVDLIPTMVAAWQEGAEVVTAVRDDRRGDSWSARLFARLFYRLFNLSTDTRITPHAGDFRLFDRVVIDALLSLPERVRFNKGLFAWVGFTERQVTHVRTAGIGRPSRWRFFRLLRFAFDGLFSFSPLPLRLFTFLGSAIALASLAYGAFIIGRTLLFGTDLPGYPSLMSAILLIGGLNMIGLGILGEYVVRIFLETKQRPLFLVRDVIEAAPDGNRAAEPSPSASRAGA